MTLEGKHAIVTGASSGIGRGIAERLAKEGVNVTVGDLQREPKQGKYYQTNVTVSTDELLEMEYGVASTFIQADLSSVEDTKKLIETAQSEFGGIDILINNVGIQFAGSTQDITVKQWDTTVDTNLRSYFLTAKYAGEALRASEQGRIVNISSVMARFGGGGAPYSAAKAGIVNMTRDLAVEFADDSVTVNAVLPGVIKTPMQDLNDKETQAAQAEMTPLPRLGEPRDVGNAVAFLVSEEAEWISGSQLLVDGGLAAGL